MNKNKETLLERINKMSKEEVRIAVKKTMNSDSKIKYKILSHLFYRFAELIELAKKTPEKEIDYDEEMKELYKKNVIQQPNDLTPDITPQTPQDERPPEIVFGSDLTFERNKT